MDKKANIIRLDQWLAKAAGITRSQAKKVIQQKRVKLVSQDNQLSLLSDPKVKVSIDSTITLDGQKLHLQVSHYILLNKPAGYICSTEDEVHPSALNLLDAICNKAQLHFAGRLDVDTTGLVLISDDGQWTHRITSPKKKLPKVYRVSCAEVVTPEQIQQLEQGVILKGDDKPTLPAAVEIIKPKQIDLTICEGRYHQVKRMLAAVGNHVELLHRQQIGELNLTNLSEGQWRQLSACEIALFD